MGLVLTSILSSAQPAVFLSLACTAFSTVFCCIPLRSHTPLRGSRLTPRRLSFTADPIVAGLEADDVSKEQLDRMGYEKVQLPLQCRPLNMADP